MSTIVDVRVGCTRPVAEGGLGGQWGGGNAPPPTGNRFKNVSHQTNICSCQF